MNTVEVSNELQELLKRSNISIQLSVPQLVEKVLNRNEGELSSTGAVKAETGKYTGRSPKDKYIVEETASKEKIDWGSVNRPISEEKFLNLYSKVITYLKEKDEVFVFNGFAGADKKYRLPIRVVNEYAWHNLFAHQLFIRPTAEELENHDAQFTVISAPNFKADPAVDGTASETFIIISFEHKTVLIGGTEYAGEMKKSIFSIMNYLNPLRGIASMHCSANTDMEGKNTAIFFGLSGTGKTTLSTDPKRLLIGDDEHGWDDEGVFNYEGGCYAKVINLSKEAEPDIYNAIKRDALLENVTVDANGKIDFNDKSVTENTRVSYPIYHIKNIVKPISKGPAAQQVIFLSADAFGVLPPVSILTPEQRNTISCPDSRQNWPERNAVLLNRLRLSLLVSELHSYHYTRQNMQKNWLRKWREQEQKHTW